MQNNGLVKLFAFLFGIVSIYQLSFTFIASNQETKAKAYAQQLIAEDVNDFISLREKAEVQYLIQLVDNRSTVSLHITMPKGKS